MPVDLPTLGLSLLAAGGGGAAIGFGLFKALGTKWLDSRFANQLEKSKQAHATEIEHLRFRIAGLMDRTTKLNQREFDVLPDIWVKAHEAHYAALAMTTGFREGVDLSRMTDAQLEWFLGESSLAEWQKDEIRALGSYDRSRYYSDVELRDDMRQGVQAAKDLSQAVSKGSIYIHPDKLPKIEEFSDRVWRVVSTAHLDFRMRRDGDFERRDPTDDPVRLYRENGQAAFDELGSYLRTQYWQSSLDNDPTT